MAFLGLALIGGAVYVNLDWFMTPPALPAWVPVRPGSGRHHQLGAEYFNIAQAVVEGRGFADPFGPGTGPTAWMPPGFAFLLAALLWLTSSVPTTTAILIVAQNLALLATGWLVLALARRLGASLWLTAVLFLACVAFHFRYCFQVMHDCWLTLMLLNGLLAGIIWRRPLATTSHAAVWGFFGGISALSGPVVGLCWGVLTLGAGCRTGQARRLSIALAVAMLTVSPWVIRNYLVFGRFIPVKANLAFELWQALCLTRDGVLRADTLALHPHPNDRGEREEYRLLGETAYMDHKGDLFKAALRDDPLKFIVFTCNRFLAATMIYEPLKADVAARNPWLLLMRRLWHPVPFLAALVLLAGAARRQLDATTWVLISLCLAYLLPYALITYYDRYKMPLLAIEALLIVQAFQTWRQTSRGQNASANVERRATLPAFHR